MIIIRLLAVIVIIVMDHLIKKLSKSKKDLALKHTFILLKSAFTDIWIKIKTAYFLKKAIL